MKALLFEKKSLELKSDIPIPSPKKGECLIRILRAGICNTDLEIIKGYAGFNGILGHEFLGIVEEMNECEDVGVIMMKDRVVGEINQCCNRCEVCQAGGIAKRNHCPQRTVLGIINKDGAFCEFITLPLQNLIKVPNNLSDEEAVFAEPLGAAFRIVEQITFANDTKIAVIGDGKLGLLITEVLSQQPHKRLSIFGHHESKMRLLDDSIEKIVTEKGKEEDQMKRYENQYDVCVEASGSMTALSIAGSITRPLGTIVLKTTCANSDNTLFNPFSFVVKEQIILGSRCGNLRMALEAMSKGYISVKKYISACYPLDKALLAVEEAAKKEILKVQLIINNSSV